jgi:hypothetical protein
MEMDDRRELDAHHPKRLSSRDQMPPPPPQRPAPRELHPNVPSIPKTRAPQYRGVYERHPVTPNLRDTFQDLSMGQTRPSQRSEGRPRGWETHTYLDPNTENQSHDDYEHFQTRQFADDRLRTFVDAEQNFEYTDPTYIHGPPRSSKDHQTFSAQPKASREMFQENIHPNYQERLHPSSLSEETQQRQQGQMRYPLRPVQIDQRGTQSSMSSPYINAGPRASISPVKAGPPTAGSVSSPFFQRGVNAPRIASTIRPPSRAGNSEFMREHYGQHEPPREGTGYSIRQKEPITRGNILGARDNQQFSNRLQSSSGYRSFEQAPSSDTASFRGPTAMSQAPSDMRRPPFTRAYVPPLQHPIASKQKMMSPRGRITLPPSTAATQNYGIANMRAVRGGLPHRAEGFSASHHQGYSGSRLLFSPVSRRSVRR